MREESIHELGNMAHQRAHSLEGRKGRSTLVSLETWRTLQTRTHLLEGRKREEGGAG